MYIEYLRIFSWRALFYDDVKFYTITQAQRYLILFQKFQPVYCRRFHIFTAIQCYSLHIHDAITNKCIYITILQPI